MNRAKLDHLKLAAIAVAVALAAGDAAANTTEAVVIPDGEFSSPDGRPASQDGVTATKWRLTAALAARVIERAQAWGRDMQVDWAHASEDGDKVALGDAPASGWLKPSTMRYVPGRGIVATIKWNAKAALAIAADEYRYLSPVFLFHPNTGDVLALTSLALINNSALNLPATAALSAGMRAALAANPDFDPNPHEGENTVNLAVAMRAALGINDQTVTDESLVTAVASLKARSDVPDPVKYVAVAVLSAEQTAHAATKTTLATLQADVTKGAVTAALSKAKSEGVELTEALETHLITMGTSQGVEAVTTMLGAMPRNPAKAGQLQTNHAKVDPKLKQEQQGVTTSLSASQKDMARTLGLTDEAYLKQLNVYREKGLEV